MNLNDSDPFFDLAMRSGGTEPESLFPVTFLQDIESDDRYAFHSNNFRSYHQNFFTYRAVKEDSCDKNSGSSPVRLLFDKSLK